MIIKNFNKTYVRNSNVSTVLHKINCNSLAKHSERNKFPPPPLHPKYHIHLLIFTCVKSTLSTCGGKFYTGEYYAELHIISSGKILVTCRRHCIHHIENPVFTLHPVEVIPEISFTRKKPLVSVRMVSTLPTTVPRLVKTYIGWRRLLLSGEEVK